MQDEKDQLRRLLAKAFNKEQMRANKQWLQFESEKARGNRLRQILEMHQVQEEQRAPYERQRVWSQASEQQQRKKFFGSSSDVEDVQVAHRARKDSIPQVSHSRGHALAGARGRH